MSTSAAESLPKVYKLELRTNKEEVELVDQTDSEPVAANRQS